MIGVPGFRPVLLISALVVVVAAAAVVAWRYELRPTSTQQAVAATPGTSSLQASTPLTAPVARPTEGAA